MVRIFLTILVFTLFISISVAQELGQHQETVIDQVGLISSSEKSQLDQQIRTLRQKGGPQLGVFITPSLNGQAIEEFSYQIAKKWQLGSKEKGDGILLLIAPNERQMRIEIGSGIEGEFTDFDSHKMIKNILRPAFRAQQYARGISLVLESIADKYQLGQTPEVELQASHEKAQMDAPYKPGFGLFVILVALIIYPFIQRHTFARGLFMGGAFGLFAFLAISTSIAIIFALVAVGLFVGLVGLGNVLLMLASSGRYGGRGGGHGGGGGWSGGGGGFSGGGSSGNW